MHIHINHCWCFDSNWGGHFDARVMVGIKRIPKGKSYHDEPDPDWKKLITVTDESSYVYNEKQLPYAKFVPRINKEVVEWLGANIKKDKDGSVQWCIGTDDYNSKDSLGYTLFFCRISDAVKFVKAWSVYKKPTSYFNYFTEDRRELNMETGKLEKVDRFSK